METGHIEAEYKIIEGPNIRVQLTRIFGLTIMLVERMSERFRGNEELFTSSNGIYINSYNAPELNIRAKSIYLQGHDMEENSTLAYEQQTASEYTDTVIALVEFSTYVPDDGESGNVNKEGW